MERLSFSIEDLRAQYDVVVVGSGYGGGVAASRLARAGRSVCVLERGREFLPGEFPDTLPEVMREFSIDREGGHVGAPDGLYDVRLGDDIHIVQGCGLGGTSLINANVSLAPPAEVFARAAWPRAIRDESANDPARFQSWFDRAREVLRPVVYPDVAKATKSRALAKAAKGLGAVATPLPLAVTFDVAEAWTNPQGVTQPACNGCGDCTSGCNRGAKNTVAATYLPDARDHGAELFTGALVHRVSRDGDVWRVHVHALRRGRERYDAGDELVVRASVVVLAAGSLGSTEILLRSKSAGLSLSDRVGQRFTGNGDALAFSYNCDAPVNGVGKGSMPPDARGRYDVGPTITAAITLPDPDGQVLLEDASAPGGLAPLLPEMLRVAAAIVGSDTDDGLLDDAREALRVWESTAFGAYRGAVHHTLTYVVMADDDGRGAIALDAHDRARVRWPGIGEAPLFQRIHRSVRRATEALGGTMLPNAVWVASQRHALLTVHPLGGCPFGDTAAEGAVDARGRVFAGPAGDAVHEGLFVMDGAVIPTSLGVNPLLTITALAERNVSLLAAARGWSFSVAPKPPAPRAAAAVTAGVEFSERMTGYVTPTTMAPDGVEAFLTAESQGRDAGRTCAVTLTIALADISALVGDERYEGHIVGTARLSHLGDGEFQVNGGRFMLFPRDPELPEGRRMHYELPLTAPNGRRYHLSAHKRVRHDRALDLWGDTTTAYTVLRAGGADGAVVAAGAVHITAADFARLLSTMRATGVSSAPDRLATLARFGALFAGNLFEVYGGVARGGRFFDPSASPRRKRPLRLPAAEVHALTAGDGVALRLTRYRGGDRGPVLLLHGLGVSSRIFLVDTIETCLTEDLARRGYDVWLLDYRASIDLPASGDAYTGDDVAAHDHPAAIAFVRAATGRDVHVVAHCFGGTTLAMSLCLGHTAGIRSVTFSQVAAHTDVEAITALKSGLHAPQFLRAMGVERLTALATTDEGLLLRAADAALKAFPRPVEERCTSAVCHRITALYAPLYRHAQLLDATHASLHELFGMAHIDAFAHIARVVVAGHIVRADGADTYLAGLRHITMPTMFVHGAGNECWLPASTQRTLDAVRAANKNPALERVEVEGYGHLDCVFGRDAARDVYPHIARHLARVGDG